MSCTSSAAASPKSRRRRWATRSSLAAGSCRCASIDARTVENGQLQNVTRYSGSRAVDLCRRGRVRSLARGLHAVAAGSGRAQGPQEPARKRPCAGPATRPKSRCCKELGLLSEEPVDVDGAQVAPKKLLDTLLYPSRPAGGGRTRHHPLPREVVGEKDGRPRRYMIDMVDRYDDQSRLHLDGAHDRLHRRHRRRA